MNREACERYIEDPEANAGHPAECAECAAFFGALDAPAAHRPIAVGNLPLAPWEGASHRPWPLVIGGALALIAIATALFLVAGESPLAGGIKAVTQGVPPLDVAMSMFRLAGGFVHNAPVAWQVAFAVSFLVVNALLALLLRRAPRGIDV